MLTNELHSNDRLHRVYQSCPPWGRCVCVFFSFFSSFAPFWERASFRLNWARSGRLYFCACICVVRAVRGDAQMDAFYFPGQAKRFCAVAARLSLVTDKRTNGLNGRYPARHTLASGWCELSTHNMPTVLRLHEWYGKILYKRAQAL